MTAISDLCDFISASPSSFHAAAEVRKRLINSGFEPQDRSQPWNTHPGGHVLISGGAVLAWWVPDTASPESGFRIIGSHTDSPGFMVKPVSEHEAQGFRQVNVEVYGGPIIPSWFDRDLAFAGRVISADGAEHLVHTGAVARIPHVAIHLDRSKEFAPDRQQETQPIHALATALSETFDAHLAHLLPPNTTVHSYDLISVDAQPPALIGTSQEFLAAGRLDNLSSVHASLQAFLEAIEEPNLGSDILVLAAFDHEEVGSQSPTGAGGPLLSEVLQRTALGLDASADQVHQMYARSSCISADAAHSVHPNYPTKHDPQHQPIVNRGPVLKINANQRYSSTAQSAQVWLRACTDAGVPHQTFVGNNSIPCGSTIGPITSTRLGIPTVDVGIPLLSMHSARELMGSQDQLYFTQALKAYLIG